MRTHISSSLSIIGPGRVADAPLVGDAGQRMRIAGVFVVIPFTGAAGVVNVLQVVISIITIAPDAISMISNGCNTIRGIVAKLEIFSVISINAI